MEATNTPRRVRETATRKTKFKVDKAFAFMGQGEKTDIRQTVKQNIFFPFSTYSIGMRKK